MTRQGSSCITNCQNFVDQLECMRGSGFLTQQKSLRPYRNWSCREYKLRLWVLSRMQKTMYSLISQSICEEDSTGYTKCLLLKKMATLFNPLVFLLPCIIWIAIMLQELWISRLDWYEIKELSSIQLSRCLEKNAQEKEMTI